MAEYINREELLKDVDDSVRFSTRNGVSAELRGAHKIVDCIRSAPACDVVEVVHASWVWGKVCGSKGYCCTNCGAGFVGENAEWIAKEHDYCPKCGAKMDGDKNG